MQTTSITNTQILLKLYLNKLSKAYNTFAKNVVKNKEVLKKKGIAEVAPKLIPPGFHDKVEKILKEESKNLEYENSNPEETKSCWDVPDEEVKANLPYNDIEDYESLAKNKFIESNKDKFEEEYEKLQKIYEQFSKRVNLKNPGEVATKLLMEVNEYSCQLFSLWNEYVQLLMIDQNETIRYFKAFYYKLTNERWCESIFRDINITTDFYHTSDSNNVGEKHTKIANKQRGSSHYQNLTPLPIEDTDMFPDWSDHPILFEECYIKDKDIFDEEEKKRNTIQLPDLIIRNSSESHLIVLVHGFQGNSEDLRLFRNNLLCIFPSAIFLSSTCNENESDLNIEDQGMKLANEVQNYIENYFELDEIKRISFVGHSLGGLIIRAAMQYLDQIKDKFYTYMSLSSPHLGYLYSPKFLVSAGMWFLKKWK